MGASFLLAGVGFTFLFYWILIIVLMTTFLAGGVTYTEVCRHMVALDESPVSGILNDIVNASFYDDAGFSINITDIYVQCKNNRPFYQALDVEKAFDFDLDTLIDTSAIDNAIDEIKKITINLPDVTVIPTEAIYILGNLSDAMEATKTSIGKSIAELEKPVTSENLNGLAEDLRNLSSVVPGLEDRADELDALNSTVEAVDTLRQSVLESLTEVNDYLSQYNLGNLSSGLQEGQRVIATTGDEVIEYEIQTTADDVQVTVNETVVKVKDDVRYRIGRCKPVYNAVAEITDSACVELLYQVIKMINKIIKIGVYNKGLGVGDRRD